MQDKEVPNDLRTAKRVVESIEDNLTEEDCTTAPMDSGFRIFALRF